MLTRVSDERGGNGGKNRASAGDDPTAVFVRGSTDYGGEEGWNDDGHEEEADSRGVSVKSTLQMNWERWLHTREDGGADDGGDEAGGNFPMRE